ncbi:hypothetical protein JCM10213v2_007969 [Rhodosporidiobolus nylandii]
MTTLPPLTLTRDLVHFRKLPSRQTAFLDICTSFLSLLSSPSHPSASSLRTAFLPALTGSSTRPPATSLAALDAQLLSLFSSPPAVVLVQTVPSVEQVENAWRADEEQMKGRVFVAYALWQEMERAKEEGEREEVANLSMMIIATLAYELAQWICVKVRGYRSPDLLLSDAASMRTTTTSAGVSLSSFASTSSGGPLAPTRNPSDAGTLAVLLLLGHDYELLTFALGTRQLIKRRWPTRRSPILTPPVVYFLTGETPAILDYTNEPMTTAGWVPGEKGGDSMYAVTAVLTTMGVARMHGDCAVGGGGEGAGSAAGSAAGSQVNLGLAANGEEEDEEEKMDPFYGRGV